MRTEQGTLEELTERLNELELEQQGLARKIQQLETDIKSTRTTKKKRGPLEVGDTVRIVSRVILPRRVEENDRIGEIIKITEKRVHVRTRNGNITRRDPNNVKKIHS